MAATVASAAAIMGPLADPYFLAMESGTVGWGDLVDESAKVAGAANILDSFSTEEPEVQWWTDEYKMAERLENWEVPDLRLRNNICEEFPVILEALEPTADGRERFRVVYDSDRIDTWAVTRSESHDECAEYAEWVKTRLVFALNQYSSKYRVESVGELGADYVVIFVMTHLSARRGRAAIPTLRAFPVSWDRDPADHTRHWVKPHMKRLSESEAEPSAVITDLLDKLLECDDCTVEPMPLDAPPTYIMTVIIPSAEPMSAPVSVPAAPAPAPVPAAAPAPVPVIVSRPAPASGPRAIDVMKANRLAWDRDGRIHRIKHRNATQAATIIAELKQCADCTVDATLSDSVYMCVVTMLR
jgi:hypothetical protein